MEEEDGPDTRTLALSDGVFAIALTLLVLSIDVPHPAAGDELGSALWDHHDELFAWLLSFVVIAGTWMRHRRLFAGVGTVDGTLTRLNLVYLAGVAFLPYPTEVLAAYGRPAAVTLYAATIAIVSTAGGLMERRADPARRGRWWAAPAIILAAIPLSLVVGPWALLVWLALRFVTP